GRPRPPAPPAASAGNPAAWPRRFRPRTPAAGSGRSPGRLRTAVRRDGAAAASPRVPGTRAGRAARTRAQSRRVFTGSRDPDPKRCRGAWADAADGRRGAAPPGTSAPVLPVRIRFAAARGAQGVALVGPLVLRQRAPGDALDLGVEAGHGLPWIRVADPRGRRLDMQLELRAIADALAPGEQHRRACALGQPRQQGHGQRLLAEERGELAVAGLGLLVGQDADRAAFLEHLPQLAHGRAFGTHLAYV